jgi:hypothetical protein
MRSLRHTIERIVAARVRLTRPVGEAVATTGLRWPVASAAAPCRRSSAQSLMQMTVPRALRG